ncbi:MAG: hypothetical protein HYX78_00045 [Armatimonadetes bacterium]|nr:hypothetical protein [Armatimonadota bacterium]
MDLEIGETAEAMGLLSQGSVPVSEEPVDVVAGNNEAENHLCGRFPLFVFMEYLGHFPPGFEIRSRRSQRLSTGDYVVEVGTYNTTSASYCLCFDRFSLNLVNEAKFDHKSVQPVAKCGILLTWKGSPSGF